jgi:hypothetical protein
MVNASQNPSGRTRDRRPPVPKVRTPRSAARRFNDLRAQLVTDLGHEPTSIVEKGMIHQAAALLLRCEQIQAAVASGEPVSANLGDQCIRLSSEARRLVANLRKRAAHDDAASPGPLRLKIAEPEESAA